MDTYHAAMLGLVLAKEITQMYASNQAVTAERITEIILENDKVIGNVLEVVEKEIKEHSE